ncbi:sulfotransferase [Nitzschia inconspicua]|uniref:Sulfotransferase n=1 Tax=Nitzschia inconspicua TaxID=303405 RepID=A0A9K3PMG8_9STRA|nr:sulfotransferase [Nitzschia inconspicua]
MRTKRRASMSTFQSSLLTKIPFGRSNGNFLGKFQCVRVAYICLIVLALGYQSIWMDVAPLGWNGEEISAVNKTNSNKTETFSAYPIESNHIIVENLDPSDDGESSLHSTTSDRITQHTSAPSRKQDENEKIHRLHVYEINSWPVQNYLERELANSHQNFGNTSLYQQKYCNLQGRPWCPAGRNKWQRRAPHFMILGVKKAGSSSLYFALTQHPKIVSAQRKELLLFSQKRFLFDKYLKPTSAHRDPHDNHLINTTHVVNVQTIRDDLTKRFRLGDLLKDPQAVSFDATPQYIFDFPTAARPILCTCPWVKLVVILRNPVDRLWSHFNFLKRLQMKSNFGSSPTMKLSFEDWVIKDLERMEKRGLLSKALPPSSQMMNEQAMIQSWHDYTSDFSEGPVGRGFYALQLHQWMKELRRFGRDPKHILKVVRLEDLKGYVNGESEIPQRILGELVEWLLQDGIGSASSQHFQGTKKQVFRQHMDTRYDKLGDPVLSNRTREWLDMFYEPQNKMLAKVLGDKGWDYSSAASTPMVWPANDNAIIKNVSIKTSRLFSPSTKMDIVMNDPCYSHN